MGPMRYRLDGVDAALFALGLLVGGSIAHAMGLSSRAMVAAAFGVSLATLTARRRLTSDPRELEYAQPEGTSPRRLGRMLLIAVGGLVTVVGLIWTGVIAMFASDTGITDADYWIPPLAVLAVGVAAISLGWWLSNKAHSVPQVEPRPRRKQRRRAS